jgi:hypothetical protein
MNSTPEQTSTQGATLLQDFSADIAKLAPQTVHPAEGYIRYDYIIPAGYYPQLWDVFPILVPSFHHLILDQMVPMGWGASLYLRESVLGL